MSKNGACNIGQRKMDHLKVKFLQDIFTTLLDLKWRWVLLIFAMSFFLSWLGFGLLFYLIAIVHGDLDELHLPQFQGECSKTVWRFCG